MSAADSLKFVVGSITVYVIMAACSAQGRSPGLSSGPDGATSGSGSSSSGAGSSASSGGIAGDGSSAGGDGSSGIGDDSAVGIDDGPGILDAITDPVTEAIADPSGSGTRLKLNYYAGADGSKLAAGLHDSMLNVDCSFQHASDGTLRCLPSSSAFADYYGDSGCTQPLALVTKGCGAPLYVTSLASPACLPYTYHAFPISGLYSGASYYSGTPASCSAAPVSGLTGTYDLYAVGAELDPSNFVQGTMQTQP